MDLKPNLHVSFSLDEHGRPRKTANDDYVIQFSVSGAPEDLGSVVYQLHPSYPQPIREKRRTNENPTFAEETTTYGDYNLIAKLRRPGQVQTVATPISGALQQTYAEHMTPDIDAAIKYIALH